METELQKAKKFLIDSIEILSLFSARIQKLVENPKDKYIQKLENKISEVVSYIHQACVIIGSQKGKSESYRRSLDNTSHRINQLELELRKQTDLVLSLH